MTDNRVLLLQDRTEAVVVNCADGRGMGSFGRSRIPALLSAFVVR